MIKKNPIKLKHDDIVLKCEQFLKVFEDYDTGYLPQYQQYGRRKYMIMMQQLADHNIKRYEILMEDLEAYFRKDEEQQLIIGIKDNTLRYIEIFTEIVSKNIPERIHRDNQTDNQIKDRYDNILNEQRKQNVRNNNNNEANSALQVLPRKMLQNYDVTIVYGPGSKYKIQSISDFTAERIGSLVACKAIVVRATQVKPEITVATYTCDNCGSENYSYVLDDQFTNKTKCISNMCQQNNMNGKLTFLPGHSKFTSYQQLKIQETPQQLKQGQIPKHFTVQLRGNLVRQATPGDIILVQGVLQVCKRRGRRMQNELIFDTYVSANKIIREKKKYVQMNISETRMAEIESARSSMTDDQLYEKLARSIAPQIYGMVQVKKSLLLLMTGGVTKITQDNMKIRGQINVALFGDPGIAKSQLLKHISYLAPRGVYTTGKGSSGVGLTAAIVRDPYTQQLALEAGALVLADMGVCCIDQFDKMQDRDRTAIHEVMEQQTISIAKAGITTTLNARTSVLAAANPLYGRYNKSISAHKNINLPAALLSRFDLIFILLDTAENQRDFQLARHIGLVHKKNQSPNLQQTFSPEFVRSYIAKSKQFKPVLTEELHTQIINRYIKKRQQQLDISQQGQNYTTMRTLLGLIRMAQARARLRFSNQIIKADIIDSLELIQQSQKSVVSGSRFQKKPHVDQKTFIWTIIKDLCVYKEDRTVDYNTVKKRVLARGHSQEALEQTIKQYQELNILMRIGDTLRIITV